MLPHDFKRKFRPVEEFNRWKASEKQVLFLHAGLPILKAYLPAEHFYHHSLLVTGIRILCEDEVTDHDIDIADAMLANYTRLLPTLFNETECNSMLAHLKRLFHGSRGISDQICRKLGATQHAHQHIRRNVDGNDSAMEFTDNLMAPSTSKLIKLENDVQFFLPCKQEIPHIAFPVEDFFPDKSELTTCQRMMKDGQVYHGLNYVHRRNSASYLVQFKLRDEQPSFGKLILYDPIKILYDPIKILYDPIKILYDPIKILYDPIKILYDPIKILYDPIKILYDPIKIL
ncbi:hypothetical protein OS493_011993 [Desmophyllum pertusum]|uniref:Uncharacterized protein n=1 Tax=Desmophyllum pertusum TaxID=174260 RepID=A0A9X0A3C4_9CNID|nr:hypothetical protein OS493_011993 [Desmophyllum pertusum]